jgi:prepilin-type N-terminal cleavage/methylation domain-containing protein
MFGLLKKDEKGFTLIEMMIVIVVIGVLMGVMITGYTGMVNRANNVVIDANLRTIYMAAKIATMDGAVEAGDTPTVLETKGYFESGDLDLSGGELVDYSIVWTPASGTPTGVAKVQYKVVGGVAEREYPK